MTVAIGHLNEGTPYNDLLDATGQIDMNNPEADPRVLQFITLQERVQGLADNNEIDVYKTNTSTISVMQIALDS